MHDRRPSHVLFCFFLLLVVWAPLPVASNRVWAAAILELFAYALGLACLVQIALGRRELTPVFRKAWPVLALLSLWLAFIALQLVPLPRAMLASLSPQALALHGFVSQSVPDVATMSVDPYATRMLLLKSVAYVVVFSLALLLVDDRKKLRWLAIALVLSGAFQAFYGSLMTLSGLEHGFFQEKEAYRGFATGTFVNRNHLAGYLEMTLATGIGLLMADLGGPAAHTWRARMRNIVQLLLSRKMRLRAYLAIMVIALVLTRSRMGNTAFFASLLIAGVIGLVLSRHAMRSTVILLASLIVIDLFIVGAWFGVEKVAQRLQETSLADESRDEVNAYGLNFLHDYFWVGSGGGSWYAAFPRYRGGDVVAFFDFAHNDFLQIACETGVVGLALLGAIVLVSLIAALIAQYRRRDPLMRGMGFAATMAIIALMIHSTVDMNLQMPANALTFVLVLAMAWHALYLDTNPASGSSSIAAQRGRASE